MLARLLERPFAALEERLGASVDYLREMARTSASAFFRFLLFQPLAAYRKEATPDEMAVARLVATREEDCGTCLQMSVNVALGEGADPGVVRAVLDGHRDALADDLVRVWDFAEAVARAEPSATERSAALRERRGDAVVLDLSLAVATARVYPTVKRGLGYAVACERVAVRVGDDGMSTPGDDGMSTI